MSEVAAIDQAVLSPIERCLARLGVRPEEKTVTALLFGNMFLSGLAIGMIRVCGYTLFLARFGSGYLSLVAIALAIAGTIVTLVLEKVTHGFSVQGYLFTILGVVATSVIGMRVVLGFTDNKIVVFSLPLILEIIYMLFSLQYTAQVTRLLNVRQTKRLGGLARSGEFVAETVSGISVTFLLNYISVVNLLVVGVVAVFGVFGVVQYTVAKFRDRLAVPTNELSEEKQAGNLLGLLKLPYVRLVSLCYGAYIFAYFFLDIAFYQYAAVRFPQQHAMGQFLGQFFAATGIVTLLAMVFMFAPVLRRFGILAGILAFPAAIAAGCTVVSGTAIFGAGTKVVFAAMVVTNTLRFVLESAIWRPSVGILFQVLPDRQRSQGTSLIEGVIDPGSGGFAGVVLYVISQQLHWPPKYFLMILAILMVGWILLGGMIRRMYLSNLVVSIQKRKLGELSIAELDNASLDIIKRGLSSPYPAEVFYCLDILEEMEHPEMTELLKQVIDNHNTQVRMDVLERIARLHITPLTEQVSARIDLETDPAVHGQALKTYAALGADDTVEKLAPFLDAVHKPLRRGALVGILRHEPQNSLALDYLLALVRSADREERTFAATVLGEVGNPYFSGFLVELLDDQEPAVVNEAIPAAGRTRDERLINILVNKINDSRLQGRATLALQMFGENALYDLDNGFTSPGVSRQVKRQIIDIVREIGGVKATELLLRHMDIDQPELRNQIYLALATLHYQADVDDQYVFVNKLEEEVQQVTWLLATMDDLLAEPAYRQLIAALGQELDMHRDNMLLLISFLFPSIVMLNTRAHIDSKVSNMRVFALEVLDNLLTNEIKQVVLPILDDLTISERLDILKLRYPQEKLTPIDRFNSLVREHFDERFFWTQASLLYLIGQHRYTTHIGAAETALGNSEPIVRETAGWALAQLQPADLWRTLQAHADDPDPSVRDVVNQLLTATAPPPSGQEI